MGQFLKNGCTQTAQAVVGGPMAEYLRARCSGFAIGSPLICVRLSRAAANCKRTLGREATLPIDRT